MMVKVAAYRLKYIHLQIYNFHLEEATFLSKTQGLPIAVNEDFLILQTRKCIKFPVPLIHVPMIHKVSFYLLFFLDLRHKSEALFSKLYWSYNIMFIRQA